MEQQKKKIRWNVIDVIIIVAVLAVIAVFGYSQLKGRVETASGKTIQMQFMSEDVSDFVVDQLQVGDTVVDDGTNSELGTVTDIQTEDSVLYAPDSEGKYVQTTKPDSKKVTITTEVKGTEYEHGAILGNTKYSVGHSMTIRAGKAKIYLRVYDIQVKE